MNSASKLSEIKTPIFRAAILGLVTAAALLLGAQMARAGVFFDDESGTTEESAPATKQKKSSSASPRQSSKAPIKTAENGIELRKMRRMGVGAQAMGSLGVGGILLELALTQNWAFVGGFGGGEGFQAFELEAKYVLTGDWLMPYFALGYANWSSVGKSGPIQKTKPAILAERLLNDDEKAEGQYRKHILFPAFGLQFMQLTGDYAGFSMFAELDMLLDVGNFVAAPTASLGLMYYF